MKIQNPTLAGVVIALRFHPGMVSTGDAFGIFDMPDQDAEFLLGTKGWHAFDPDRHAKAKAAVDQVAAAAEASKVREAELQATRRQQIAAAEASKAAVENVKADEKTAQAAYDAAKAAELAPKPLPALGPLPDPLPDLLSGVAPESSEGPNLAKLDKTGLIETAEGYGVAIDRRWSEQRLREVLHAALYDDAAKAGG